MISTITSGQMLLYSVPCSDPEVYAVTVRIVGTRLVSLGGAGVTCSPEPRGAPSRVTAT